MFPSLLFSALSLGISEIADINLIVLLTYKTELSPVSPADR